MSDCPEGLALTSRGCLRLIVDSTEGGVPFKVPHPEPIIVELPHTGSGLALVGVALVMILVGVMLARWGREAL